MKIKTFEETMVQLDDVFTNTANGENEQANLEVAEEIRKMQSIQMDQIFELQKDISNFKALKEVPHELAKILRRAFSNMQRNKLLCVAEEEQDLAQKTRALQSGTQSKRQVRSKSRTKKK